MELTPPLAPSDSNPIRAGLPEPIDGYLARLADHQTRFLAAWTDANRSLHPSSGQVAKVASLQVRLTQEFLDAQRAIVRRRAETDAAIVAIAADAAAESAALVEAARSRAAIAIGTPLPPPAAAAADSMLRFPLPAPTPTAQHLNRFAPPSPTGRAPRLSPPGLDDDSLARLIDGVFESSEPDGAAARRELRDLLDGWWSVENQEAQAAIDDAQARAAMHVHLAQVEADELARFAPPSTLAPDTPTHCPLPSTALSAPFASALDDTDHEHLDDVLAHLLDSLEPTTTTVDSGPIVTQTSTEVRAFDPHLPAPADSLHDRTAAPQEAFDRFWGAFSASGTRSWFFPQLLLPAVTVIAVLALVLAVVG
jgi:hypothetical protein